MASNEIPDLDAGEAIVAALGMGRVLRGGALTPAELERVRSVEDDIRAGVGGFLRGEGAVSGRTAAEDLPDEIPESAATTAPDPEVGGLIGATAQRAIERARALKVPRQLPGLQDREATPGRDEAARRRRFASLLESVPAAMKNLDTLGEGEAESLREIFPTLTSRAAVAALEEAAGGGKLTRRKERALSRLIGRTPEDVREYQALHAKAAAEERAKQGELATPTSQTPIQEIQGK